jgi:RND family efflux transporter MFP subunit
MAEKESQMADFRALSFVFVNFSALLLSGCGEGFSQVGKKPDAAKAAADRPVLVTKVKYAPLNAERTLVAVIRPRIETDVSFRVAGKVAERLVEVGQTIEAGQILARLDTTDLNLQREQAEAELRAARSALAQVEADTARLSTLRKQGWSTAANMDRQAALLAEAKGRLERAEKAAALAANALSYAVLRAEAPGVVTTALIERGQVVAAGQAVLRIARPDEKEAVVAVPEAMVERVRTGKAKVSLWSRPDVAYSAKLRELSPVADAMARTYSARFAIEGAPEGMMLGMSANVVISDAAETRVVRLPLAAVADTGKGPGLFVVDRASGSVTWKPIDIVRYEAATVLVRNGVEDGAWVVALGVQKIDPSQRVRAVDSLEF